MPAVNVGTIGVSLDDSVIQVFSAIHVSDPVRVAAGGYKVPLLICRAMGCPANDIRAVRIALNRNLVESFSCEHVPDDVTNLRWRNVYRNVSRYTQTDVRAK